jgi:hypothetical protein
MGINGKWEAFTMPRWLLVLLTALGTLSVTSGALGWRAGRGLAAVEVTLVNLAKVDAFVTARIDTLRRDVDTLKARSAIDSRVLRAIGKDLCRSIDPAHADDIDLPCAELRPLSARRVRR